MKDAGLTPMASMSTASMPSLSQVCAITYAQPMSESVRREYAPALSRWAWGALALVSAAVVFFIANFTQGACYDSGADPAASYCTSGPIVGVAGAWVLWAVWVLLAVYFLRRIIRRRKT